MCAIVLTQTGNLSPALPITPALCTKYDSKTSSGKKREDQDILVDVEKGWKCVVMVVGGKIMVDLCQELRLI